MVKTIKGKEILEISFVGTYLHMKTFYLAIATWIGMSIPEFTKAQTTNNFSGWAGVFTTVTLHNKFSLHLEGNLRSTNEWEQIQTLIFRAGLNYRITQKSTVTLGYAFASNRRVVDGISGYSPEDRIYEQFSNMQFFYVGKKFTSLQNRFRLEQRFIGQPVVENNKLVNDGFSFTQRLRYFFRAILPLVKTPDRSFQKGAFISLQNEIFLNVQNTSAVNGKFFDQNRAYFSIGYRFSPKNDTEIGYMYQFVSGKGTAKTNNNIIQLATYLRL